MYAHAWDLRAELPDLADDEREALVRAATTGWREGVLSDADRALCAYAEKLTREPWTARREDLDELRRHGFADEHISDAVQVIGYFNYINRVADGLGVDLEDFMPPP